ncbi:hypothetical protein NC651_003212 [Populus alba x Populus x berolinensis]|nr:hypothetical protein NC651_003212 [Populus alba x Populus x berolinensis]
MARLCFICDDCRRCICNCKTKSSVIFVIKDGPISHGVCKEGSLDQQYSCRDLHKLIRKKTSKTEALERLHHRSRIFFVDTVVVFTNFFMAAMYIY